MKHDLYKLFLKLMRMLAKRVQLGNPAGKAPRMLADPLEQEMISDVGHVAEGQAVWQLRKVFCSGLYGGAVLTQNNQLHSRFLIYPWGKDLHPVLCSPYLGKNIASVDKAIFLITVATKGNYYHWMADLLPRLLLVLKTDLADLHQRRLILHHPARAYEIQTLSLMGIEEERIIRLRAFETVAVEDLLMADYLHSRDGQAFPLWKKALLDEFKSRVLGTFPAAGFRKIYLLRGRQRIRRLIGEEQLVEVLKGEGFEILDPQQMSLQEQMQALSQAQIVVGLHGAALTNILFCPKGTLIIELRSSYKPPEHYAEIATTYQLQFDTITLAPERVVKQAHLALQQNLLLTDEHIKTLLSKLLLCEV